MKKTNNNMKAEYSDSELKNGVRGKYYDAYQQSHNFVKLDPVVAEAFPDDESVNTALLSGISHRPRRGRTEK